MAIVGQELFESVQAWARSWARRYTEMESILDTSWAVWLNEAPEGSKSTYPGDEVAAEHAHGRIILLAMNPGNDTDRGDWSCFHSTKRVSNDHFLREACRETGLTGAVMTDYAFDQFESTSGNVKYDKNRIYLERLDQLVQITGEENPLVVCLSVPTFKNLERGIKQLNEDTSEEAQAMAARLNKLHLVKGIHYGIQNGKEHKGKPDVYRERIHEEIRKAGFGYLLEKSVSTND